MANCQVFKQWLDNQEYEDIDTLRQVKDHIQNCRTCEKLYRTDMALETMLKKGMQSIDPPPGLIGRARHKIESESRPRPSNWLNVSWKTAVPVLSMAALVLIILVNPFSGHLQTVDEVVAHSIINHLDTSMELAFRAGEVSDVGQWFTRRLGYPVRLPDLEKMGLSFLGGRKCTLGKADVALLFCNSKGKRASVFVIDPNDVDDRFGNHRQYIVKEGGYKVTLWQESGLIYAMVI
jgi:anti-sigma factor RsiW